MVDSSIRKLEGMKHDPLAQRVAARTRKKAPVEPVKPVRTDSPLEAAVRPFVTSPYVMHDIVSFIQRWVYEHIPEIGTSKPVFKATRKGTFEDEGRWRGYTIAFTMTVPEEVVESGALRIDLSGLVQAAYQKFSDDIVDKDGFIASLESVDYRDTVWEVLNGYTSFHYGSGTRLRGLELDRLEAVLSDDAMSTHYTGSSRGGGEGPAEYPGVYLGWLVKVKKHTWDVQGSGKSLTAHYSILWEPTVRAWTFDGDKAPDTIFH